jgi:hypothetical protein
MADSWRTLLPINMLARARRFKGRGPRTDSKLAAAGKCGAITVFYLQLFSAGDYQHVHG